MIKFRHTYDNIISLEKILSAWKEFIRDKKSRKDTQEFGRDLMGNIILLYNSLKQKIYTHGGYHAFNILDPKPRSIHKASVRDRLLHHLIYQEFYAYFDKKFIHDSYSCRIGKGTHKAINRFMKFAWKVSKNNTKQCWVLKCDIKKFFASINHEVLKEILNKHIEDQDIFWLLGQVIDSFWSKPSFNHLKTGLPLGNLTSQLLVNIYMNEFDQFVKHKLKIEYYIRYADDFILLSEDKEYLENMLKQIKDFLEKNLKLTLHPDKISIKTISSGVDFLGWVHFPKHRVLRTSTKKRMFRNIQKNAKPNTVASYLGLLKHGNTFRLKEKIKKITNC